MSLTIRLQSGLHTKGKMLGKLANLAKGGTIVGQNKNYLIFTSHRNNITHYK